MTNLQQHLSHGRVNTVNTPAAQQSYNADREETTVLTTRSAVGVTLSMRYYNATAVNNSGCTEGQSVSTLGCGR